MHYTELGEFQIMSDLQIKIVNEKPKKLAKTSLNVEILEFD